MKDKGILKSWNEERGFGFIRCDAHDGDIFIHISALEHMARKPRIGDVIYFDRVVDKEGKTRAEYASIKGVVDKPVEEFEEEPVKRESRSSNKPGVFLIFMGLLSMLIFYQTFSSNPLPIPMPEQLKKLIEKKDSSKPDYLSKQKNFSEFSCQGKEHCSQMTSCKEAIFYLKNCPNVKIDGDRDGVPCEKQFCQ